MTAPSLKKIFAKFGEVESCYLRKEPRNQDDIGVVIYSNYSDCEASINYFQNPLHFSEHNFIVARKFSELNFLSAQLEHSKKSNPDSKNNPPSSKKPRKRKNKKKKSRNERTLYQIQIQKQQEKIQSLKTQIQNQIKV